MRKGLTLTLGELDLLYKTNPVRRRRSKRDSTEERGVFWGEHYAASTDGTKLLVIGELHEDDGGHYIMPRTLSASAARMRRFVKEIRTPKPRTEAWWEGGVLRWRVTWPETLAGQMDLVREGSEDIHPYDGTQWARAKVLQGLLHTQGEASNHEMLLPRGKLTHLDRVLRYYEPDYVHFRFPMGDYATTLVVSPQGDDKRWTCVYMPMLILHRRR